MPPIILIAIVVVNLALIAYGIGVVTKQRTRRVGPGTLNWLRFGVVCDITATTCMIAGSSHGPFTLHGLLGFSSLTAMIVETACAWRHRAVRGDDPVPTWLQRYALIAYGWWIVAYVSGGLLVMRAQQG